MYVAVSLNYIMLVLLVYAIMCDAQLTALLPLHTRVTIIPLLLIVQIHRSISNFNSANIVNIS